MEGHEDEKLHGVASSSSTQHSQFASATEKPILDMEKVEDYHLMAHLDQFQSSHYIPLYYSQVNTLNQIPRQKFSLQTHLRTVTSIKQKLLLMTRREEECFLTENLCANHEYERSNKWKNFSVV
ncbi:hypothetical protein QN277_006891 [Acacia crassicarpa]|uniref:Uncharacterized protein n=1 Tax=Acacia crassicarpa TaxID=499986 RepID=A0AAE1IUA0_9FABA|nr:hypothetical protein QN277_006891 [Acacia crassicarpa]